MLLLCLGTGVGLRIATASVRTGFAMTEQEFRGLWNIHPASVRTGFAMTRSFTRGAGRRADVGSELSAAGGG